MPEQRKNQNGQEQAIHEEIIHRLHHVDDRLEQLEELLSDYAALLSEEYEDGEQCENCHVEELEEDEDETPYEPEEKEVQSGDAHEEIKALISNIESRLDFIEDIVEEHIALDFDEDEFEEGEEDKDRKND